MEATAGLTRSMSRHVRVCVIGSGNVATHLARALDNVADVAQVYSRDIGHARELCGMLSHATPTDSTAGLIPDAGLYLVAVRDDAIRDIAGSTPDLPGIWAHTSGSITIDALASKTHRGVFYPLQTFSRLTPVDMTSVPLLTEASDDGTLQVLDSLASLITRRVSHADSVMRSRLHIAAVFGCNFVNYMWTLADDLLRRDGHDITLLDGLLRATLDKALAVGPAAAQTGPARRGDHAVIDAHIASLPGDTARVYDLLSSQIMQRYEQNQL